MLLPSTGVQPDDLRAVLDLLGDGVVLVDDAWTVTTANAEALRLLGVSSDDPTGRSLWQVDPALAGAPEAEAFRRAMAGAPRTVELRRGGQNGDRWVAARLAPRPGGLLVLLRDVTAERSRNAQAEQLARLTRALAAAADIEAVLAAIVDDGLAVTGAAAGIVGALSEEGKQIRLLAAFGYPEGTLQPWSSYPVEAPTMTGEACRTGLLVVVETAADRLRRYPHHREERPLKDGGAGIAVPLLSGGRTVGVLGLTYPDDRTFDGDARTSLRALGDLCAHALARAQLLDVERAARAEAERLREEFSATFDQAPIGVAHTDRDHRWLRFNPKLCEITGYSAEELHGLDWRAITHPDDLPAQLALERRMLGGEIPGFTIEKRYLRKDGVVIWIRLSTATVQQEGQPIYSVAMIEEITERKRAEANTAFLAELDRRIRPLADADAIAAETVAALAAQLKVDRCLLRDVDEETWSIRTVAEWAATGVPAVDPTDTLAAWEVSALERARDEHRAFRVDDVARDPVVAPAADRLSAIGVRALLGGTFVQGGRWVALLSVVTATARAWRDDEAALVQAVLDHVWPQLAAARAADQLRRSEERYRAIVASTTSTVFRLDADGRTDDAFAAWWQELTGQDRAAMSGWGWLDVVLPEDRDQVRAEQERGVAGSAPFESAYRLTTISGEERHLLVRAVPLLHGDDTAREWFGTVTDVTQQRRQEAALARQANLLDQAYDAFIAWEIDGPILYWNQGAERLYGFAQAEALGHVAHDLLRTEHADGRVAMLADLEASGAVELELTHVAKDGRSVTVRSRHQLVQDGDRRIVLEAHRDVTELKALERAQQDFTAAVSHDLKNPIGTIKAEAQLTLRRLGRGDPVDPERLGRSLSTIDRLTDSLTGLVNDLVDVSVLRSGQTIELAPVATDLGPIVERAVGLHRPRYGGEIALTLPDRPLQAAVDERRLDRVLGNLLGNAVKFSPTLGLIDVELRTAERGGQPVAEIVVRDTGVGIPAADLPVVFERFQRGSNVGGVAGTGIGLAGARQIVELHGGTITVESVEGAGSAFTVTLPLGQVGQLGSRTVG